MFSCYLSRILYVVKELTSRCGLLCIRTLTRNFWFTYHGLYQLGAICSKDCVPSSFKWVAVGIEVYRQNHVCCLPHVVDLVKVKPKVAAATTTTTTTTCYSLHKRKTNTSPHPSSPHRKQELARYCSITVGNRNLGEAFCCWKIGLAHFVMLQLLKSFKSQCRRRCRCGGGGGGVYWRTSKSSFKDCYFRKRKLKRMDFRKPNRRIFYITIGKIGLLKECEH
jgi:hypothetical protein